LLLKVP